LNRALETTGLLDTLEDEGIGCIAFCPLAQGLLTGRYLNGVPEDSRAAKANTFLKRDQVTPERIEQIRKLDAIAKQRGQSLAQMALAWVLRGGRVTSALIGASRVAQIEENVKALANREFSAEELRTIDMIVC
ncbi:MAG: aldo/keto reductase, partial [Kiritimatiellales bacterium]